MKRLLLALIFLLATAALAEQSVEHGGRKIVTFDVPQVEFKARREGKITKTYYSNRVGNGNLKITIRSKGWLSELVADERYSDDRRLKRASQHSRLNDPVEVPGAMKTLSYSMSSPFVGQAIVIYTKDFRCEFLITGTKDAGEQIEPTFQQLLKTLKVVPRTKIGEIKVEGT